MEQISSYPAQIWLASEGITEVRVPNGMLSVERGSFGSCVLLGKSLISFVKKKALGACMLLMNIAPDRAAFFPQALAGFNGHFNGKQLYCFI